MFWPKLPLWIGCYYVETVKQAIAEVEVFSIYCLGELSYYWHDLDGNINIFFQKHDINWKYNHETWVHEEDHKQVTSWLEVERKLQKNKKTT